ncbi:MAG: polysaccharide deacetylase family protein [Deltaproteobacteria bacterium]|nr:polysaccharide deacetylase family protein [Deltaproteobacteria bacterium]
MEERVRLRPRPLLILSVVLVTGLWLNGCTPLESGRVADLFPVSGEKGGLTFKSEDYVVYRLQGWETAADLAETFLGSREKAWIVEDVNRDVPYQKGRYVVIPLKEEEKGGLWPEGYQVVPILCYHGFGEDKGASLSVSPKSFEQQMKYLRAHNYRVIGLKDLKEFLGYRKRIPERSVVITVDDGYRSFYDVALPVLRKYGFQATIFIYAEFIGQSKNALGWDQLKEIKGLGFEIGSHGLSHDDLTKQRPGEGEEQYLERLRKELTESKRVIDGRLNQDTEAFAYPYGKASPRLLIMAEQAGYKLGLTVQPGSNPFFSDPMALKRNQIVKGEMGPFIAKLVVFKKFSLRENSGEN